jgi:hypothetical protein
MQTITWSPNLYNIVKAFKQQNRSFPFDKESSPSLSLSEKSALSRILLDKKIEVQKANWC